MSYTPTTWATGDTITAVKLNKMEQGIADGGGGALIAEVSNAQAFQYEDGLVYGDTLDTTFGDIYDALSAGIPVYVKRAFTLSSNAYGTGLLSVLGAVVYDDKYKVYVASYANASAGNWTAKPGIAVFTASNASAYPVASAMIVPSGVTDHWD